MATLKAAQRRFMRGLEAYLTRKYGDRLDFLAWRHEAGRTRLLAYGLKDTGITRNTAPALLSARGPAGLMVLDLETTSLDPQEAQVVGLAYAEGVNKGYLTGVSTCLGFIRQVLNEGWYPCFHHGKYDLKVIRVRDKGLYSDIIKRGIHDTELMAYVLDPSRFRYGLDYLVPDLLGFDTVTHYDITCPLVETRGVKPPVPARNFQDVPKPIQRDYAMADAHETLQLAAMQLPQLRERGLTKLYNLERRLVPELAELEMNGLGVDVARLQKLAEDVYTCLADNETKLLEATQDMPFMCHEKERAKRRRWVDEQDRLAKGEKVWPRLRREPPVPQFNPGSDEQVAELLYDILYLPEDRFKTKGGQRRTDAEILKRLRSQRPEHKELLSLLLEHRELDKIHGYAKEWLVRLGKDNRLRGSIRQTRARTGRMAHAEPNLGNVARQGEWAKLLRRTIIPPEGYVLGAMDYNQLELRLLAHFSRDPKLIAAYQQGIDLHQQTADAMGIPRDPSKMLSFLVIYQGSAFRAQQGLMADLGMHVSLKKAQGFIDGWYETYPGVLKWMGVAQRFAKEEGYVRTILGRILPTQGSDKAIDHIAVNWPIQGSGGDIIRAALLAVGVNAEWSKWRAVNCVHDDILFEVREDCVGEWRDTVGMMMCRVGEDLKLRVPLAVEAKTGPTWADLKPIDAESEREEAETARAAA